MKNFVIITGVVCAIVLLSAAAFVFLYLSDSFRPAPVVTIRADNTYADTLHAVTDIDYEPFSYLDNDGNYVGLDVELIAEIANRLHMNLDLKLMSWPEANNLFFSGKAQAFLNMETDSVIADRRMTATLPTTEKQYVVYGREEIHAVPELYGRKVASLHRLPELGLGDGITYLDSYSQIFEALRDGDYEFAICPIQVGNVFLEKLKMSDFKQSYAVGHVYGAIALHAGNDALREKINAVISDMQKEGIIDALDRKWVSHRYQSMTLSGMLEAHPGIITALLAGVMFVVFLFVCVMLMNKNIRDKDAYSRELLAAKLKAEESSRAKSEFLSNMSHEIRTPINAVLGMSEMIIRESPNGTITSYARKAEAAGKNLLSMVNDILDFSKIDSGKMSLVQSQYKLDSLLNDTVNMVMFSAKEKGLSFSVNVDKTLPDDLYGDELHIRQALNNVLSNAVKFTKEGGVTFTVGGEKISDDTVRLIFTVHDTGVGIKREEMNKLFAEFERVSLDENRTIGGTGLGLAITHNLLAMMGGEITAESEYGKGSTFTVTVPQKVTAWAEIGDYAGRFGRAMNDSAENESFTAPDAKILAVDDTEMNLTVVAGLLAKTKIHVDTALSGADALKLTAKTQYDLVFMDQMMPEMNGTQALNAIRSQEGGLNTATPVVCLTADAVSGAREKYLAEGFTDYLSKPVGWSDLVPVLRKYIPAGKIMASNEDDTLTEEASSGLEEFYAKIDGLNYSEAVKFCMNEEILAKTLESFYKAVDTNAGDIERFLAGGDIKNYTIKVHALKSSARLIGAMELSKLAAHLEDCGNNNDVEEIESLTPKLLEDYRGYGEKLAPLFAEDESGKPEIDAGELGEIYEAIREFAYSFDIDSIDGIIEQARKYRIPANEAERFGAIEAAARNMDWDALSKALG